MYAPGRREMEHTVFFFVDDDRSNYPEKTAVKFDRFIYTDKVEDADCDGTLMGSYPAGKKKHKERLEHLGLILKKMSLIRISNYLLIFGK